MQKPVNANQTVGKPDRNKKTATITSPPFSCSGFKTLQ
jgi:hypothetical protein